MHDQQTNTSTDQRIARGRRRWIIALAIALASALAIVAIALSRLDGIVRDEIEQRGSAMTQTAVTVEALHVSLAGGSVTLRGLTVANPPGFTAPYAFELGEITVELALSSVFSDPLVIREIRIDTPQVTCELDAAGMSNVEVLRRAVESAEKQHPAAAADQPRPREHREARTRSAPRRLIIERLTMRDGGVRVDARAVGGPEDHESLPGFELTDIGVAQGGATPAEVGRIVITALARDVAVAVAATQLERFVGKQLGGPAGDLLKKGGAEAIRKGLGGVLDQLLRR